VCVLVVCMWCVCGRGVSLSVCVCVCMWGVCYIVCVCGDVCGGVHAPGVCVHMCHAHPHCKVRELEKVRFKKK